MFILGRPERGGAFDLPRMRLWSLLWLLGCRAAAWWSDDYSLDDAVGLGRQFDGIGAVSGGGVGERRPRAGWERVGQSIAGGWVMFVWNRRGFSQPDGNRPRKNPANVRTRSSGRFLVGSTADVPCPLLTLGQSTETTLRSLRQNRESVLNSEAFPVKKRKKT